MAQKRKRVQSALDPKARTNLHTRAEDVALVVYLYTFGWNFQHAKDSRHCKELLPYDRGALKFLQDLDMQRIPNELVAVLEEAAPKPLWNGCFVVEVRDHRSDHLDFEKSRALKSLMPDVRRIRLYPTPASLLGELQNLCYEHKPTGTQTWSEEEWVGLERRMLSRIQGPVCLDPSVLVFCIANVSNYNRIKYSPTLTKCRTVLKPRAAGDVVEEDERVPVLKKSVYSPLVSFLTRGKRVRQKAQPSHEPQRPNNAAGEMPEPPTQDVAAGLKGIFDADNICASLDAQKKTKPAAGERSREIVFKPSPLVNFTGAAFMPQPQNAGCAYVRNIIETKQCAEFETWHDRDSWQVCVRSPKEAEFHPKLSYFFDTAGDADRVCDELKRVCTTYEKRALMHDQRGKPKVEAPPPNPANTVLSTHIDAVRLAP